MGLRKQHAKRAVKFHGIKKGSPVTVHGRQAVVEDFSLHSNRGWPHVWVQLTFPNNDGTQYARYDPNNVEMVNEKAD